MAVRLILAFMDERTDTNKKKPRGEAGRNADDRGMGVHPPAQRERVGMEAACRSGEGRIHAAGRVSNAWTPGCGRQAQTLPLWCEIDVPRWNRHDRRHRRLAALPPR